MILGIIALLDLREINSAKQERRVQMQKSTYLFAFNT